MQGSKKIPLTNLNPYITCKLCNGYFVDATTIIECLHSFCRSCIVKYLEKNRYCPVCDVLVHKTKPLLNIRPDKTIQDMVYKLVPRLYQNEMRRRREFYNSHPEAKPSNLEQCSEAAYLHLLTPEETVCLTMVYHDSGGKPRYLRCPSAVTVNHLKKLIRAKYDLTENHRVDILYNQDCLTPNLTLMDIVYIYLWKKKGPIELTYRIYENIAKKPKLDLSESSHTAPQDNTNNNNWKEVQLRISENGEMSITDIQGASIDELVNTEPKYKNDVVMVVDSNVLPATKKEIPELKPVSAPPCILTASSILASSSSPVVTDSLVNEMKLPPCLVATNEGNIGCATLSSETNTTTVYSTINTSKCSTTSEVSSYSVPKNIDVVIEKVEPKVSESTDVKVNECAEPKAPLQNSGVKRKCDTVGEVEPPPPKQPKPTILNHTIGLLNLSNNHPLKKHSKLNRNGENINIPKIPTSEVTITPATTISSSANKLSNTTTVNTAKPSTCTTTSSTENQSGTSFPKQQIFQNKALSVAQISISRPGTPITVPKPAISITRTSGNPPAPATKQPVASVATSSYVAGGALSKAPCYVPRPHYSPSITVSKAVTTITTQSPSSSATATSATTITPVSTSLKPEVRTLNANYSPVSLTPQQQPQNVANPNNKLNIKSKPSTPIGYKTLRDPPKSWNSQISKANLSKSPQPDPKVDLKSVRPAKFFKMRNNMPRYLGNPASGVKPMYQVHVTPDKDKAQEPLKAEKSEIKKHSIVKIDPKTLKPISEKAPDTANLSNHRAHSPSSSKNSATAAAQALANHKAISQAFSAAGLSVTLTDPLASAASGITGDLKINTSSVSIFNPLKLQSSSPKGDRKSPKSPHSPKMKTAAASPTGVNKREKPKVNFTPPNPFVPMSPTGSPFLYSGGATAGNVASTVTSPSNAAATAGGFPPPYDPRVMAAYQYSLWYGQRMAFPGAPLPPGLAQFDVMAASHAAAQAAAAAAAAAHAQQQASVSKTGDMHVTSNIGNKRTSSPKTIMNPPNATITSRTENLPPKSPKLPSTYKKSPKEAKNEKSLENAVEKLTQNRHKEIANKQELLKTNIPKPDDKKLPTKDVESKVPIKDSKEMPQIEDKAATDKALAMEEVKNSANKAKEATEVEKKIEEIVSSKETKSITDTSDTPTDSAEKHDILVSNDTQKTESDTTKPKINCNADKNEKQNSEKNNECVSKVDDSSKTTDSNRTTENSDTTCDAKSSEVNHVKKIDVELNVPSDENDGCNKVKNGENIAEKGK
ncbi:unnamed protein product [Acanthoscelides obtectus]|uniref:RING-type domain-containing protein n=1 Tax=Acanthoscelides obtectus TaxID=200917 RepID=A0A9P0L4Q9_ACAOB|nr:unnamed protein product [Acanthoscelides obtectus]CAK1638337.1 Polycomb complex protein BMI-1 [Acanthoscelides obtectus]